MAPKTPTALAMPMMVFSPVPTVVLDVEADTDSGTPVEIVWLVGDDDTFRRWLCAAEVVDAGISDMSFEERIVLVDWDVVVVGTE